MKYRLRTLGIVVALIAVALAIGRQIGPIPSLVVLFFAGFIAPAFLKSVWLRAGVAFTMSGLSNFLFLTALSSALDVEGQTPLVELLIESLPYGIGFGLLAVAISSGIRWLATVIYWDFQARPGLVESPPHVRK